MKTNKHLALCEKQAEPQLSREDLAAKVEGFLACGGKIKAVPAGVSGYQPLSAGKNGRGGFDEEDV